MNDVAVAGTIELQTKYKYFEEQLQKRPDNLDELTFVLSVIANVKAVSEDVEIKYRDVDEEYRTLSMYNIAIDKNEKLAVDSLPGQWKKIVERAKQVDDELIPVKARFTETTQKQVREFKLEVKRVKDDFRVNGPGGTFFISYRFLLFPF